MISRQPGAIKQFLPPYSKDPRQYQIKNEQSETSNTASCINSNHSRYEQMPRHSQEHRQQGKIKLYKQNSGTTCSKTNSSSNTLMSVNLSSSNLNKFPQSFQNIEKSRINELIMDDNQITQCNIQLSSFSNLQVVSLQTNYMVKFTIKPPLLHPFTSKITTINLSYNNLQFLDLSPISSLVHLTLSHNQLSTLILPQSNLHSFSSSDSTGPSGSRLEYLNLSYNNFSNIQYSVLSGKVFGFLKYLNIRNNNKCLYDIVLGIGGVCLVPQLLELDCGNNIISYIQDLPKKLEILNIQNNELVLDRRNVNQLLQLNRLKLLNIGGNFIGQNYIQIIKSKMSQPKFQLIYTKQQPIQNPGITSNCNKNRNHSNVFELKEQKPKFSYKQSPYRIYEQEDTFKNFNRSVQGKINQYSNFTLGDQHNLSNNFEYQQFNDPDPEYNLVQMSPTLGMVKNSLKSSDAKENYHKQFKHIVNKQIGCTPKLEYGETENRALKSIQNTLKPQKYKIKIEGTRYINHYRLYFQKLKQFMVIPPHPIFHSKRSTNISVRIDPVQHINKQQAFINQFQLLNEMFQNRGGVHYIRKVYNWQKTQLLNGSSVAIMFVNIQLTQLQFQNLCDGDYSIINHTLTNQRHCLNLQPSSFTCYHILARLDAASNKGWSCLYLVEAVHL